MEGTTASGTLVGRSTRATLGGSRLRVAGLFAGIGGIELGLHNAGHTTELLCEVDPDARAVLEQRFPDVPLVGDVRDLTSLPEVELVTAGFPCQDLSQAGKTAGIRGTRSGLVEHVFRLLEKSDPDWVLLENVPFMLQLERGRAMRYLVTNLGRMGFRWAYRVVDTRAFGLPQRRQRVLLLASREHDPRTVLLSDDTGEQGERESQGRANGFYWTEGLRGLGWAPDAVPTLKGGSSIGIPSPPAVWMPSGFVGTPDINDAERLQGFEPGWTAVDAHPTARQLGSRWKLVGNAVSVPVAEWLGQRLREPGSYSCDDSQRLHAGTPWSKAAWGESKVAYRCRASMWPEREPYQHLDSFLKYPLSSLSVRAARGFLARAERALLRFPPGLLDAIRSHAMLEEAQLA